MTQLLRLFTAILAVVAFPGAASFQSLVHSPLDDSHVRTRTRSTTARPVAPRKELPPRACGSCTPPLAMSATGGAVNGDSKATFRTDRSLLAKTVSVVTVVTVATVITYALHNHQLASMGPVQASGVVSIASTLLLPEKLALAALCGSFAGMAKTAVVPTLVSSGLLGVLCAGVMRLFDKRAWLIGFGGRLGFIAQCACTLQLLIFKYGQKAWQSSHVVGSALLGSTSPTARLADFSLYEMTTSQIKAQLPPLVLFTVAGALFMRLWKYVTAKCHLPNKVSNSVAAVGMTGLLGGLYLPASMAGPAFCGSFVAMASPSILPSLLALVLASVLAGMSQLGLTGLLLGGWGGKLGTAAFLGVLGYRLMVQVANGVFVQTLRRQGQAGTKQTAATNPTEA